MTGYAIAEELLNCWDQIAHHEAEIARNRERADRLKTALMAAMVARNVRCLLVAEGVFRRAYDSALGEYLAFDPAIHAYELGDVPGTEGLASAVDGDAEAIGPPLVEGTLHPNDRIALGSGNRQPGDTEGHTGGDPSR